MLHKHKMTIKREFFVTGLSSVLIIAIIFISLLSISIYQLSIDNAKQKLKSANVHLSTYTEGVLESLIMSTKINAIYSEVAQYHGNDLQKKTNILNLFKATTEANRNIKFCYAGYENGELLINDYIVPAGYDATTRPWYVSAVAEYPELSVGLPYQDIKTEEWLVSVSEAFVNEAGKITGVIAVDCSLAYVKALMSDVVYYKSQSNYVVDSNGDIFVHPNPDYLHQNADVIVPGLNALFVDDSGYVQYQLDGSQRLAFYKKMPKTNWIVVSAIDESEIMDPIFIKIVITVLGLIVLSILLGFGQVKLYETRLVKPILTLRDRIAEITIGKSVTDTSYKYSNIEFVEIANRIEKMAQTSLRKKTYELELILESTSDGILVVDLEGKVIHTNSKFQEFWSLSKGLRKGDSSTALKENLLAEHFKPQNILDAVEHDILYLENGIVLEQYSCALNDGGIITGRLWSYRDITEKIKVEEELKRLATTDSLTGLWNRRYFIEKSAYEMGLAKQNMKPLSLLFIDIDYFKHINDTFGHGVGDEALQYLAIKLTALVRSSDLVTRFGGEEFCVLLVGTNQVSARLLAEKIRSYFDEHSFSVQGFELSYTLSIGIASYDEHQMQNDSIELLIAAADNACYEAKANGRNCVMPK